MGQAKQRGTLEDRIAQAKARPPQVSDVAMPTGKMTKASLPIAMMMAMGAKYQRPKEAL